MPTSSSIQTYVLSPLLYTCNNLSNDCRLFSFNTCKTVLNRKRLLFVSACPALTVPDHSTLSPSDPSEFYEGKTVTMTCDAGYTAVGVEQVTCISGAWNDTYGTCEKGIMRYKVIRCQCKSIQTFFSSLFFIPHNTIRHMKSE